MTLQDKQPEIIHNFRRLGMGWWYPVISISPDGLQRAYLPFPHWLMCDHHKDYIQLEDLIDGPMEDGTKSWIRIQAAFAQSGKQAPQREYTHLLWREA